MKETFTVTVESPYGKQPIEQWLNWIRKVASEADTRWGIDIRVNRQNDSDDVSEDEFQ